MPSKADGELTHAIHDFVRIAVAGLSRLPADHHDLYLGVSYFENFGKRLIKSPKIYLGDSGWRATCLESLRRRSSTGRLSWAPCSKDTLPPKF